MTRYTVVWSLRAQNRLAQLWTDASDKKAVSAAANAIDALLAVDPQTKGTPLNENLRALAIPPLHVLFTVYELDRIVRVASVRIEEPPAMNQEVNGNGELTS
jgi:plasmid stabilization system protein ParE